MRSFQAGLFTRVIITIMLGLVFAGCSHVAGNYPARTAPKSALPEEFKTPYGMETDLVWTEPGRVHGFLSLWRDTSDRAATFRKLAADSGLEVHREGAHMYADLSEAGIAEAALWVFFGRAVEIRCNKGDFEIKFGDGTVVRDQGVLYVEPRDVNKPYRYTRGGGVVLSNEPVGEGEPLRVLLFVPKEHLAKKIVKVVHLPDG